MNGPKEQRGSLYWLLVLCAALALCFLLTCRGEWVTEVEREPFTVKQKVDCYKTGVCCVFDLMDEEYKCGLSMSCPGEKWVLVEVTPYEGFYSKRPEEYLKRTRERRIKDLSKCE